MLKKSSFLFTLSGVLLIAQIGMAAPSAQTPEPFDPTTPVEANADWTPIIQAFDDVEMVLVPPGCFIMGTDEPINEWDGTPAHEQCFDTPFWLDRYEITNEVFDSMEFTVANDSYIPGPELPRQSIFWKEALDYCVFREARLPTEREWEYAGRGPDNLLYPWGNEYNPELTNVNTNQMQAPGSYPEDVSWVGAFDLVGNVREHVSSAEKDYPYDAEDGRELLDPEASDFEIFRITRGSAAASLPFSYVEVTPLTSRLPLPMNQASSTLGFRCARDWSPEDME